MTTGNILLVTISALVGQALSPSSALTTLPVATQMLGLMLTTVPASLLMARVGRKVGFSLGNVIGIIGALLGFYSLINGLFWSFSFSCLLIGIGIGFATLYRFAAIEVSENPATAISAVMASGVIAAILGPSLAVWVNNYYPEINYANAFIALTGLYILSFFLLQLVKFNELKATDSEVPQRNLSEIMRQPKFVLAVCIALIGYTTMNLLMTATPLAMHRHGFDLSDSAVVIKWHVLGMFVPSFFTGKLINRFGQTCVMQAGGVAILICCFINLMGQSHWHFLVALCLLGVGWNFMFISATHMVSESYLPHERAKSQASNEFLVFSMVTVSSLGAGWLEAEIGWKMLNIMTMPVILVALVIIWQLKPRLQTSLIK